MAKRVMRKTSPDLFGKANPKGAKYGGRTATSGCRFPCVPTALRDMFPVKTLAALMYFGQMSETNARRVLKGQLPLPWTTFLLLIRHEQGEILLRALMAGEAAPKWWTDYDKGVRAARRAVAMKKMTEEQQKFLSADD